MTPSPRAPGRRSTAPAHDLRPWLTDLIGVVTPAIARLDPAACRERLAALVDAARALLDVGASAHVADSLRGWSLRTRQTTQRMAAAAAPATLLSRREEA